MLQEKYCSLQVQKYSIPMGTCIYFGMTSTSVILNYTTKPYCTMCLQDSLHGKFWDLFSTYLISR